MEDRLIRLQKEVDAQRKRLQIIEAALFGTPVENIEAPPREEKEDKRKLTIEKIKLHINKKKELSKTELIHLCHTFNIDACQHDTEESLKQALLGEETFMYGDPYQEERINIKRYTVENKVANSLALCDLNCPACPTHRVAMCITKNYEVVKDYIRGTE